MRGGAPLLLALLASCEALGDYASARFLDLGDCVKLSAGGGIGLTVDAKATTYMSPGLGFASYLYVVGWDSRDVHGFWLASDVVNTPRLAYEWFSEEYQETPPEAFDEALFLGRLALTSMALPAERWIRHEDVVTVEYFSLFNFGDFARNQRATSFTGFLLEEGQEAREPIRDVWTRSWFEVGATAGVVHARVGVNPLEFVDFLLGLFGLDPAGDDAVRLVPASTRPDTRRGKVPP